jgi:hypothetical protein
MVTKIPEMRGILTRFGETATVSKWAGKSGTVSLGSQPASLLLYFRVCLYIRLN